MNKTSAINTMFAALVIATALPAAAHEPQAHAKPAAKHDMAGMDHSKMQGMDHAAMGKAHFTKLDVNKDSVLTKRELPKAMQSHFAMMDTNKDGKITMSEMDHGKMKGMDHSTMGKGHFMKLDVNRDGVLTQRELPQDMQAHFAMMDKNKDGKLTQAEMMSMHSK